MLCESDESKYKMHSAFNSAESLDDLTGAIHVGGATALPSSAYSDALRERLLSLIPVRAQHGSSLRRRATRACCITRNNLRASAVSSRLASSRRCGRGPHPRRLWDVLALASWCVASLQCARTTRTDISEQIVGTLCHSELLKMVTGQWGMPTCSTSTTCFCSRQPQSVRLLSILPIVTTQLI